MASSTSQGFPERFRSPLRGVRSRSMRNERTKSCCPVHCPRGAGCSSRVAGCWAAPKVLQRWAAPLWVPAKAPSPRAHLRPWHHLCVCWCWAATPSCCLLPFGPAFGVSETPKRHRFLPVPCAGKRRDWSGVSSRDMDVFPLCSQPSGCTHVGLALQRHRPWQKNTPSVPSPAQCPPAETSASLGQGALADVPGCRCPGAQGKRS